MSKTSIGLDKVQSAELANKLNELLVHLSSFSTQMYVATTGIFKGVNFFEFTCKI